MSEMVERVGEALRKSCMAQFGTSWSNDTAWEFARAAIEAMREPTAEMIAATDVGGLPYTLPLEQWRLAIDEALK